MWNYFGPIIAVFVTWNLGFVYAAFKRRNDVADILWGLTFALATWVSLATKNPDFGSTELLISSAGSVWGLRLAYHIGARFLAHEKEDQRYNNWREEWGNTWLWRSYLQVFTLQPLLALIIVWPAVYAIAGGPREMNPLVIFGAVVWIIGFFFESVADSQLKKFKSDPAHHGKIMDQGLWRWSRHPNYFGEITQWWGVYLMTVQPESWWLIISPITITFFIMKVSGVTMLENLMAGRPGFAEYKARTSVLFPLPPRR